MEKEEQRAKDYVQFAAKLESSALEGNVLSGVAHTFGTKTMRNGRWETFSASVFDKTLRDPMTDARAFVNHNPDLLLGRQSAKTLTIETDAKGLNFSIDLPNTSYANDLKESVKRGDLDGVSFGFIPGKWSDTSDAQNFMTRLHTEASQFIDISPCTLPAFGGTSVELRADELQALMTAAEKPAPVIEPAVEPVAYIDAKTQIIAIRNAAIKLFGGPGSGPQGHGGTDGGHTHSSSRGLKEPGDLQRHLTAKHGLNPTDLRGGHASGNFLPHASLSAYHDSMHA